MPAAFASFHSASISSRFDSLRRLAALGEAVLDELERGAGSDPSRVDAARVSASTSSLRARFTTANSRSPISWWIAVAVAGLDRAAGPRRPPPRSSRTSPASRGQSKPTLPALLPIFCARARAGPRLARRRGCGRSRTPLRRLLRRLDLLPLREHLARWSSTPSPSPKTCGWRRTSLSAMPCDHVVDVERALGAADRGLEDDLHQQIAELLAVAGGRRRASARRAPRRSPRRGTGAASRASARGPTGSRRGRAGGP